MNLLSWDLFTGESDQSTHFTLDETFYAAQFSNDEPSTATELLY